MSNRMLSERELYGLIGAYKKSDLDRVEVGKLIDHIEAMRGRLDEADMEDALGTEGWRRYFGIKD